MALFRFDFTGISGHALKKEAGNDRSRCLL
jgi:hypothetical protein